MFKQPPGRRRNTLDAEFQERQVRIRLIEGRATRLCRQDYAELHKSLAPELRSMITVEDLASKIAGKDQRRVHKWVLRGVVSHPRQDESIPRIDRTGTVIVDFETIDRTDQRETFVSRREIWSHAEGVWHWWWRDWKSKA